MDNATQILLKIYDRLTKFSNYIPGAVEVLLSRNLYHILLNSQLTADRDASIYGLSSMYSSVFGHPLRICEEDNIIAVEIREEIMTQNQEKEMLQTILSITDKGHKAEVEKGRDGYKVLEVSKRKVWEGNGRQKLR